MIPDPLDADPMERFALENPLQPLDPEEALASPIVEKPHFPETPRQGERASRKGSKPRAVSPLSPPDFFQSPFPDSWNADDKTPKDPASSLRWSQSQKKMVPETDDPNQGSTTPTREMRDISVLRAGGHSPPHPASQPVSRSAFDPFDTFAFGRLDPSLDGEERLAAFAAASCSLVLSQDGSRNETRQKKEDFDRVRTGRIDKGRGHNKTASLTSFSRSEVTNASGARPPAQLGDLTSRLTTIMPFVRLLEETVAQLPPHGEDMKRSFLEKQASSLSEELHAVANDVANATGTLDVSFASASGVSTGNVGLDLTQSELDAIFSQE